MKQSKLTPSALFLITFVSGLVLSWIYPWHFTLYMNETVVRSTGVILLIVCLILNILAYRMFKSYFTPHAPFSAPTVLIESGVFAWSRNPVYMALVVSQCGLGFILDSVWLLPSSLILWITLHYLIVAVEEKVLESLFKERYIHYQQHTRRWL